MDLTLVPRRLAAVANRILATRSYRRALREGDPAGAIAYSFTDWPTPDPPLVE